MSKNTKNPTNQSFEQQATQLGNLECPPLLANTIDRRIDFSDPAHPANEPIGRASVLLQQQIDALLEQVQTQCLEFEILEAQAAQVLGIQPDEAHQYNQFSKGCLVWKGETLEGELGERLQQIYYGRFKLRLLSSALMALQGQMVENTRVVEQLMESKYGSDAQIAVVGYKVVNVSDKNEQKPPMKA
jgi:hypothetical protein